MPMGWLRIPECDHKRWSPFLSAADEKWMPLNVSRGCKGFILQMQAKPIWRQCWGVISPRCKPTSSEPKHNKASNFNKLLGLQCLSHCLKKSSTALVCPESGCLVRYDLAKLAVATRAVPKREGGQSFYSPVLYCESGFQNVVGNILSNFFENCTQIITWQDDGHLMARPWW